MAGQNSAGPLLVSLAAALARPGLLPEPAARLARQVLAQRVVAGTDGRLAPDEIARAVERSGVLLEARLAGGRGDPLDLKSLLLGLRDRLAATLPAGTQAPQRAAPEAAPQPAQPPLKGLPLRAAVGDVAPLPQEPKDALRMLHDQSDATVSRIKLAQIASLPDRADAGRANPVLLRLEVPLLFGHELVMAQIAVGRDGGRRNGERKRGWSFKFALKSAATGEVGADVGLLGRTVHVALWAADPRTAEVFSACLPELRAGLEGAGLTPASVQVRRGVPPAAPGRSGELLDSMS
jgi:hypothetical protein